MIYIDSLFHYGVKGMKWGVRHDKPSKSRASSKSSNIAKSLSKMNWEEAEHTVISNLTSDEAKAMLNLYLDLGTAKTQKDKNKLSNRHNELIDSISKRLLGDDASKPFRNIGSDSGKNFVAEVIDNIDEDDLYYIADGGNYSKLKRQHTNQIAHTPAQTATDYAVQHHNMIQQQILNEQIMQQSVQAAQYAAQEANRAASLSMTYGMNPFMFG